MAGSVGNIGGKRLLTAVVLVAINAVILAALYWYIVEENDNLQRQLKRKDSAIRNAQTQVSEIRYDREKLVELQDDYERILESGFLQNQDRLIIQRNFDEMANVSKIINANYNATRGQIIENNEAKEAGYALIKTDLRVDLSAIDDIKLYNFLYLIDHYYPGLTNIQRFKIEKVKELSKASLIKMTRDDPEPLVEGALEFEWLSMVKEEDLKDKF